MRIKDVEYLKDYKLKITFTDKAVKIVDLESTVSKSEGIFFPLKDLNYFKKVSVDDCQLSICWPNGADICPDLLYELGKEIPKQKKSQPKPLPNRRKNKRLIS